MKIKDTEFINLRPILGNFNWAKFLFLIGGAQAGKSYAVIEFFIKQWIKDHNTIFYWIRLTEKQASKLLTNNAEKLIDPDLKRKYNLDIVTKGQNVYVVTKRSEPDKLGKTKVLEKVLLARVLALSTFYSDKGNGYFDKDYKGWYNIGLDEFQPEKNERRTFDVVYAFVRQMENLVRNTKTKVRIIGCCNLLEEASDILSCFEFLPEEFGIYKLKSKQCCIWYIKPTNAYKSMRKGSIADILLPNNSQYNNKQTTSKALIQKISKHNKLTYIIKFSKDEDSWFCVYDDYIITAYKQGQVSNLVVAMSRYLNEPFRVDAQQQIFSMFDNQLYRFNSLIDYKRFQTKLSLIKTK